jgi:hypothetical protein
MAIAHAESPLRGLDTLVRINHARMLKVLGRDAAVVEIVQQVQTWCLMWSAMRCVARSQVMPELRAAGDEAEQYVAECNLLLAQAFTALRKHADAKAAVDGARSYFDKATSKVRVDERARAITCVRRMTQIKAWWRL